MKDPAFLFYSKDWIEGTAEMLPEEKGVYIDLLAHQHQSKDLPADTARLARIARLSHEEFLKVWETLQHKFLPIDTPNGKRTVNRKLSEVMGERLDKGHKNKVIGTFASLIRKSDLNQKEQKIIKSAFNVDDFTECPTDLITERLTEWFNERLKSIVDANKDVDANTNELIDREKKFYETLAPFVKTYPKEMIREFYDYWREPNKTKTKMRWEKEDTWEIELRLKRWANNNKSKTLFDGTDTEAEQKRKAAEERTRHLQSDR